MGVAGGALVVGLLVVAILFIRKRGEERKAAASAWQDDAETVTFTFTAPARTGDLP